MNIPNLLSIFRIFVTLFFIIAVNQGELRIALYLFIIQGISDLLDGFFARIMDKRTSLGTFLDPIADKVMLVSSYIVLCLHSIIPFWVTAAVLFRDVVVSSGFLVLYKLSYKVKLSPSLLGKLTTAFQVATVIYILWSNVRAYEFYFFSATVLFTIVSGCQYVTRGFSIFLKKENV
jgi:cardiolipin synthase